MVPLFFCVALALLVVLVVAVVILGGLLVIIGQVARDGCLEAEDD